ncbi:MAG: YeeE/YedE family protein [Rhodospirillaceae bacterium]|nr:YeeE/YedE family protein [Rhodospirillaceae bacterium]
MRIYEYIYEAKERAFPFSLRDVWLGLGQEEPVEHFTPISSLIGGGLIGLSAVLLMLLSGRIAGISGITSGLLSLKWSADTPWRLAFVVGLIAAPLALMAAGQKPEITFVASLPVMVLAGFVVGFGTVLGGGCTSGHGVCGIARLSPRSIIATLIFMAFGIATVFVVRHVLSGG